MKPLLAISMKGKWRFVRDQLITQQRFPPSNTKVKEKPPKKKENLFECIISKFFFFCLKGKKGFSPKQNMLQGVEGEECFLSWQNNTKV